jgi:hypothetical protein
MIAHILIIVNTYFSIIWGSFLHREFCHYDAHYLQQL